MAFNKNIDYLNPQKLVNDENFNSPLKQLKENIDYLLRFVNGNRSIIPLIFGNLLDFNERGEKIFINGGNFDSFKKCHIWKSISELRVTNDDEIIFDENGSKLVYRGRLDDNTNPSPYWLERDIFIPEYLRNTELMLGIKCAGSSEQLGWSVANAQTEDIAIQVIGASDEIKTFHRVGAKSNFDKYASTLPEMTTSYVNFKVSATTETVRVRIFRTVDEGYLHIDKIFVGGITGSVNKNVDINEIYDFINGQAKITATSIMGHNVNSRCVDSTNITEVNLNEVVTFKSMISILKGIDDGSIDLNLVDSCDDTSIEPDEYIEIFDYEENIGE